MAIDLIKTNFICKFSNILIGLILTTKLCRAYNDFASFYWYYIPTMVETSTDMVIVIVKYVNIHYNNNVISIGLISSDTHKLVLYIYHIIILNVFSLVVIFVLSIHVYHVLTKIITQSAILCISPSNMILDYINNAQFV